MCENCKNLSGPALDVMVGQMERAVMLAEADAGLTPEWARRPLSADERRARVRFREIMKLEDEFLAIVEPVLELVHRVTVAALLASLPTRPDGTVDPRVLVDALDGLTRSQPDEVVDAVAAATPEIESALAGTYVSAGLVVIGELKRQGVGADLRASNPAGGRFYPQAKNAALEPYRRLLSGMQDYAAAPQNLAAPISKDDIVGMLGEVTTAKAVDQARQGAHAAMNAGRFDTAETAPIEFAYASELLDERTCDSCAAVDGREYASVAEARADYGDGGGFRACDGGARCRGTAVFVARRPR